MATTEERPVPWFKKYPEKNAAYHREYRRRNHERVLAKERRARARHRERDRVAAVRRRAALRQGAFDAYGHVCGCCGETREVFLVIDHVNGGGTKQRRELGSTSQLFQWFKTQGYPPGFQTLCHNCNYAKYRGGCPHGTLSH